jgi:hypothetical protein
MATFTIPKAAFKSRSTEQPNFFGAQPPTTENLLCQFCLRGPAADTIANS